MRSGSPASTPTDLLTQLRSATRAQHEALDGALLPAGTQLTRSRYVALLLGSLAVLHKLEPAMVRLLGSDFASDRRERLEADLARLTPTCALPSHRAAELVNRAQAWGAAYVIEGSALGGVALARLARVEPQIDPAALSYLELRGARTGEHWRSFCARLNAWGAEASADEHAQSISSARATFQAYADAIAAAREPDA